MHAHDHIGTGTKHYAKCIEVSRHIRWDLERDVVRGRRLDPTHKFMPDGLSLVHRLRFLDAPDRLLLSQIQGRTYANMLGLIERFINAKMIDLARAYRLGNQVALEALVRFVDEELKHQELFRRIETLAAQCLPEGYRFLPASDEFAAFVLDRSTWAVLALTCLTGVSTRVHYRQSADSEDALSPLFQDLFFFHWKEEAQHATVDELEWSQENERLDAVAREWAIEDLIALVNGLDGLLHLQAQSDLDYFLHVRQGDPFAWRDVERLHDQLLAAYRWQYIVSGFMELGFATTLAKMVSSRQLDHLHAALSPLMR